MHKSLQDVFYALRQLARNPGFALVAILTLAVGIGASAAMFSIADAILLRPLPFPEQGRLVQIQAASPFPKGWIRELQNRVHSFTAVSGYTLNSEYNITGAGSSDRAFGCFVSTNLFETLGVRPALGRFFSPSEGEAGQDRVIVLSYSYWREHLAADRGVIGRNILVDGSNREVVGIAPSGIYFPDSDTQFWIPISFKAGDAIDSWADSFNKRAIGRLREGVPAQQAQTELRVLHPQMLAGFPWRMPDVWAADTTVTPLLEWIVGPARPRLLCLLGAVGLVLLIACANVANLMLARAASREKEIVVRTALGASMPRLLQQMLTESMMLGLIASAIGCALAVAVLKFAKMIVPPDTPRAANIALDSTVFLFAAGVGILSGILSGLAPAWHAIKRNLQGAFRSVSASTLGGRARFRVSKILAIGQIALAVVVITASGVMFRSFDRLMSVDPGFRADRTISAQISLDRTACEQKGRCTAFFNSVLDRTREVIGVQDVALADRLPLGGSEQGYVFDAEDHPRQARDVAQVASGRIVSPHYFSVMGIRLIRGRFFGGLDESGTTRAIILSESLAKRLWPNQDPIGKHTIEVGHESSPGIMAPNATNVVVGVVGDTHNESLAVQSAGEVYLPMSNAAESAIMTVIVRSTASFGAAVASLRKLIAELNPSVPMTRITTLDELVYSSAAAPRSLTALFLGLALLAVTVGMIGVYSLVSYTVSWRIREIGVRMALGASRPQIAFLIFRQSLLLTLAGSGLGLLGAVGAVGVFRSFLFETSPADPLTYAIIPILVGMLALVATWRPASRASRVEPMTALRTE